MARAVTPVPDYSLDWQNMTQEELKRRNFRKVLTIVVLVLVVLAIYIGSFFVVTG
jgi:flagellar basal body-associated protein FliL